MKNQNNILQATKSWKNINTHYLEVLKDPWYRLICDLENLISKYTYQFYFGKDMKTIHLPITTSTISSPMGLGSDSSPVKINLVDIDKALSMYDKDYLRFYVTYVVKDNITDFKFELSEFKNVINSVLCKNIGGFYKRCRNILYKYNIEKVPDIEYRDAQFDDLIQLYKKQYKNMESYKLLMDALIYIKHCGKEIELNKIYNYPTIENIGLLCFMMAGALILMKKFIPDLVEIYNIFEELDLSCISSIDNLKGKKIIKRDGGWGQI